MCLLLIMLTSWPSWGYFDLYHNELTIICHNASIILIRKYVGFSTINTVNMDLHMWKFSCSVLLHIVHLLCGYQRSTKFIVAIFILPPSYKISSLLPPPPPPLIRDNWWFSYWVSASSYHSQYKIQTLLTQ